MPKALQKLISENSETLVGIYNLGTGKKFILEVVHAFEKSQFNVAVPYQIYRKKSRRYYHRLCKC